MICPDYIDRDGIAHWKENSIPESTNKIMQFTGLIDKQGKEIYEGDIIRQEHIPYSGQVEWNGQAYWFVFRYGKHIDFLHMNQDNIEVIGNIYESPELLEKSE